MTTDNRTANLNLPLPHEDNNMRTEDLPRLITALTGIDSALAARPDAAGVAASIAAAITDLATQAALDAVAAARVPTTRAVGAGTGLTGGGGLGGDITLSLSSGSITSLNRADTAVQPARIVYPGTGMTGGGNLGANITLSLSSSTISSLDLADSAVQPARQVIAGDGLNGGGDLTSDVELEINFAEEDDALAGVDDDEAMNPLRTRQMLDQRPPGVKVRVLSSSGGVTPLDTDKGGFLVLASGYSGNITLPATLSQGFAVTVCNDSGATRSVVTSGGSTIKVMREGTTGSFDIVADGVFTAVNIGSNAWRIMGGDYA